MMAFDSVCEVGVPPLGFGPASRAPAERSSIWALGALLLTLMLAAVGAHAGTVSELVATPHVTSQLLSESSGAVPGKPLRVVLDQTMEPHWHTYWRNPGDSGIPTEIKWTLPPGWKADPIQWPTPSKFMIGPLANYGYEGHARLISVLHPPRTAKGAATIVAEASWLVCKDVCVPGRARLQIDLQAGPGTSVAKAEESLRAAAAGLPRDDITVETRRVGASVQLAWPATGPLQTAVFIPDNNDALAGDTPQTLRREGASYVLTFGKPPTGVLGGVLVLDGKGHVVKAKAGETATPAAPAQVQAFPTPAPVQPTPLPTASPAPATGSLLAALALAFLGGAILNLMPCVFPVLSMKALALARHDRSEAHGEALAYGAGVVISFGVLGGALLALRAAGSQIGWGFQLQSPPIVAALAFLTLALGLSLSGVFAIGTSVMGLGSNLTTKHGIAGSFFTGVLAAVVAAPCTAPFMGAAVGFALLRPWAEALAVFIGLGAGMAAPFVALTWASPLTRILPRPGAWMERLKQVLAFPLYATSAWLIWVLAQQVDASGLALALAGLVTIGLAAYCLGLAEQGPRVWTAAGVVLVATSLALTTQLKPGAAAKTTNAYSDAAVNAELAAGRPVFVDFTAAWCITCIANEKATLSQAAVKAAFQRKGVIYMVADWTNQDPVIAAALQKFGRAGVPLYLLYTPSKPNPQILPQILTVGSVTEAIDALPDRNSVL
jgi:thiol:disulfide interchange protein/DsbC/DsbD-like thiol-disulfide interchange protein